MFQTPFVQSQQFMDAWIKMTQEQLARMEQMQESVQKLQGQAMERTREAIDESARLMKETLNYTTQLSEEWRKVTTDAVKKATESFTPKA